MRLGAARRDGGPMPHTSAPLARAPHCTAMSTVVEFEFATDPAPRDRTVHEAGRWPSLRTLLALGVPVACAGVLLMGLSGNPPVTPAAPALVESTPVDDCAALPAPSAEVACRRLETAVRSVARPYPDAFSSPAPAPGPARRAASSTRAT
jgi:hypothetical protein